ncbi:MAG TPA: aminotransferase class V-fold PLP-dependent enzyme, partial [Candidatus Paceibacterota bacterium]|nr:aminotransferase class V-fold PLP-dependent enzyme [Candidatus Paceibacterota bacterium]
MKHTKSHLTHALNHITHKAIRWCTPSIDSTFTQVKNPYASDTSISFESLGYPSDPSGIFKKIYEHAAKAYGADHTLFSVNGTTGSNFMVLRALSKQIPNLRVLSERNVHRSIVAACEDYGINLIFLEPNIDQEHQLFLPSTEQQIYEGIEKTKPQVLLLTNPTYEGMCLNLKNVISTINKKYPDLIVFVDEAWGAHLHFSDKLPISAMEAGADICVQSTHKQGGSLQQSGMIHWNEGR